MRKNIKLYLWLCYINLFISAFTFGGGYVVVPMIKKYYVMDKKIFSESELVEMATIAQSSPGAIAINLSILASKRTAGFIGVIISCICSIIPPIVILGLVSRWYVAFSSNIYIIAILKGMQACVAALIVDLTIDMYKMILNEKSMLLNLLVPFSFIACTFLKINVILVLLLSCLICLFAIYIQLRKKGESI
ncbi:chromate transporter [Clostridioides sp. ES-S-0145-01]|uniref:chromate transporter n=1 Tax=Clostridioides sp. ES-S-0145-01 TaxID=2770784 RepID=UPI001D1148D7|nr:chromate transporter [Clostridioides sp. ES-S-0145-01]